MYLKYMRLALNFRTERHPTNPSFDKHRN